MAIIDALLKIDDSNGNLKKITATEENYLAYQAGLQLAAAGTSEVASLNTSSGTSVGTHTDTQFDQAVGTHPGSSLTTTTTNTTIYQTSGTAPENIANFVKPVLWDKDPGEIEALNDSQLNTVADRLIATIFGNDYPGVYRLASSAPSGDYTAHLSNVFTDNRTDGTAVNYTIWKRQTMSAPTVVKTIKLEGTGADLKGMTNTEIKVTFGQRAKTRIMSTGIGTYQLRSSAQGAPTDPGTWVAKGTALDTKQQTADQNYTRDSTRASTRDSTNNFTRVSTSDYVSNYTAGYVGDYVNENLQFTGTAFSLDYVGNYDGAGGSEFIGNYDGTNYIGEYIGAGYTGAVDFTQDFTQDFAKNYERTSTSQQSFGGFIAGFYNFIGDYIGNYIGNYTGNYIGDVYYLPNYSGDYIATYSGNYLSTYDGNYVGNYEPNYVGAVNYTGEYGAAYESNFTGDYTGDYVGNFIGDYLGNYIGNYAGETIQATSETIETYTLYVRTA